MRPTQRLPITTTLDHLTVTAGQLERGVAHVQACLGVSMQPGGTHPRMGTHNCLLRLGAHLFLEVIAPNPAAPAPGRPRWFGLDRLAADAPAALSSWVIRSPAIEQTVQAATEPLGSIEPMTRGTLQWHITLPASGDMALDGVAPAVIAWPAGVHPATSLPDQGVTLMELHIHHPDPDRVQTLLTRLQLDAPVQVHACASPAQAGLRAVFQTPHGQRVLGSLAN